MNRTTRRLVFSAAFSALSAIADAKEPNCANPDAWPGAMAFVHLKNAGVVDSTRLDFAKTAVAKIASEQVGKDLYRQVHLVRFFDQSGETVTAITVNEASGEECSLSGVDVYLVSKRYGDYSKGK